MHMQYSCDKNLEFKEIPLFIFHIWSAGDFGTVVAVKQIIQLQLHNCFPHFFQYICVQEKLIGGMLI